MVGTRDKILNTGILMELISLLGEVNNNEVMLQTWKFWIVASTIKETQLSMRFYKRGDVTWSKKSGSTLAEM